MMMVLNERPGFAGGPSGNVLRGHVLPALCYTRATCTRICVCVRARANNRKKPSPPPTETCSDPGRREDEHSRLWALHNVSSRKVAVGCARTNVRRR